MYLTHMNALLVEVFSTLLDPKENPTHPVLSGRSIWVGPEFPAVEANYPGVWVTYDPGALRRIGIGHREVVGEAQHRQHSRWAFDGVVSLTVVALSRRDRDELLDEIVRLFAFSTEHPSLEGVRSRLTDNDLIYANASLEDLRMTGLQDGSAPWATEEMVHEGTISFPVEGNFVSDTESQDVLVPLSAVVVEPTLDPALGAPEGEWM